MAKSHNQKAKILFLAKMLRDAGEYGAVSMQEILDRLAECGIRAERKSIYDDIEALRDFGYEIAFRRGKTGGYYLTGLPEGERVPAKEAPVETGLAAIPAETGSEAAVSAETGLAELAADGSSDVPEAPGSVWRISESEIRDRQKTMRLVCPVEMEEKVRAYFGSLGEYKEKENGSMTATVPQTAGPEFYGWLTAMEGAVRIQKPRKLAAAYRDHLKTLAKAYKGI